MVFFTAYTHDCSASYTHNATQANLPPCYLRTTSRFNNSKHTKSSISCAHYLFSLQPANTALVAASSAIHTPSQPSRHCPRLAVLPLCISYRHTVCANNRSQPFQQVQAGVCTTVGEPNCLFSLQLSKIATLMPQASCASSIMCLKCHVPHNQCTYSPCQISCRGACLGRRMYCSRSQ